MKLRKILRRAARMCPPAYGVQKLSVLLACVQLFAAFILLNTVDVLSPATYRVFRMVHALLENSSAVLLIGVLGAVCIEDRLQ